jgi:CubicO group peptidase (beta-lactamase class C family)
MRRPPEAHVSTLRSALISACVACLAAPAAAEDRAAPTLDPHELEAFFDAYLGAALPANHVPGAVVYVVKDGQVLFRKGYGLADVERNVSMDPDRTVLTLGSLSKLFTWTAVMQLAEQGKLDLDADVNRYLDFAIPATYPEPITLNHLMAHTAGFEDRRFGQMARSPAERVPLGAWLAAHVPARVRPPGRLAAYQNYGAALAGYVVERVSGEPFDDYVERHVLRPLGMGRTSSRAPLPAALAADAARPYLWRQGAFRAVPEYEVVPSVGPAAAFCSTGGDMARFLAAHLGDGHLGGAVLLRPETVQRMQRRSFAHDPRVNGMAHGLWELDTHGQRILGHAGSHFIHNGLALLLPERRLGVFVATNGAGGNAFVGEGFPLFVEAFADHFFPAPPAAPAPGPGLAAGAGRFAGSYALLLGRAETTPEKLLAMLMAVQVRAGEGGITAALPGGRKRFVETEPLVFRQVDGPGKIVFRADAAGEVTHAFLDAVPLTALVRARGRETPAFNLSLLLACALLFASALLAAPVAWLVRQRRGAAPPPAHERRARWVALALAAAALVVLWAALSSALDVFGTYTGHLPLWSLVRPLSIVTALLAAATAVSGARAWSRRWFAPGPRVHHALVALAGLAFTWFLREWNVLGKGF